ncbi:MAG: hypothetical protein CO149_07995, partial [Nitrospirae bacterium CG_4_9_14_3_um_filter_51_5]
MVRGREQNVSCASMPVNQWQEENDRFLAFWREFSVKKRWSHPKQEWSGQAIRHARCWSSRRRSMSEFG